MGRTKKKIYLAVVVLGGLGLLIDRTLLSRNVSGPLIAAAQQAAVSALAESDVGAALGLNVAIPELNFPRGLAPADADTPTRDWFAPPLEMITGGHIDRALNLAGVSEPAPVVLPQSARERFAMIHRLEATVALSGRALARVDGRWVALGDEIGGCSLQSVAGHAATFSCEDGEAVLKMFQDLVPSGQQAAPAAPAGKDPLEDLAGLLGQPE